MITPYTIQGKHYRTAESCMVHGWYLQEDANDLPWEILDKNGPGKHTGILYGRTEEEVIALGSKFADEPPAPRRTYKQV